MRGFCSGCGYPSQYCGCMKTTPKEPERIKPVPRVTSSYHKEEARVLARGNVHQIENFYAVQGRR